MLFSQLVKANLQTKFLGREIEYYQRLGSTNVEAFELIDKGGIADGTMVITDHQFEGKGRQRRSWFASPGKAVTFSVILRPEISTQQNGLLSLAVGVAVAEAVEKFGLTPTLKWPNDIRISGKKCGGALVETKVQRDSVEYAVVGIGLNVNESLNELPEELRYSATTLSAEKGSPLQRELVVAWILNALERWIDAVKSGKSVSLRSAWQEKCDHLNKTVVFSNNGENRSGTFSGVGDDGAALIKTSDDEISLTGDEISINV